MKGFITGILFITLAIAFVFPFNLSAQDTADVDEQFKRARALAFDQKDYVQARSLSLLVLSKSPDYHEVRIFLGRLYAWDNKYDEARKELNYVLQKEPDYFDARSALIDVEMWSDNNDDALTVIDGGLNYHKDNEYLLLKKAKILLEKEKYDEADELLNIVLTKDPANVNALNLKERLRYSNYLFKAGVNYEVDIFDRPERPGYGPFHFGSFELGKQFSFGSIMARSNYAHRYFSENTNGSKDIQFEVDAYPRIMKGMYAYLNGGFSPDAPLQEGINLFPRFRGGAELFKTLPKSFEVSGGSRYLNFTYPDDTLKSTVIIYTASLGKYIGNYWFSLRSFFRPVEDGTGNTNISHSELLFIRKYWESKINAFGLPYFGNNFIGLTLGRGSTPLRLSIEEDFTRLNSYQVGITYQQIVANTWIIRSAFNYQKEQWNTFDPTIWGNRFNIDLTFQRLFFKAKYKTPKSQK